MTANKIMHLDLEVQNHPYYGAIASPRHPDNYVVLNGWRIDPPGAVGQVEYFEANSKEEAQNWLKIPDDVSLIVAHNAPFEIDWMLVQQREELMKFLKRGGRIWCTAYAHYLLSNQLDTYPSLDVIAPMYGGTPKVDGVKILWDKGVLTADIDRALLLDYLVGPSGDVANTATIFYAQYKQLTDRGMLKMAFERMEGMLFCCFAMDAGLHVDREIAFKQLREGEEKIAAIRSEFLKFRTHIPEEVGFKESSDYHMSAWLFGGPIKYKARVPALDESGAQKYESTECYMFGETPVPVGLTAEEFERCVITYGPCDKYKAGKNKGLPKVHKVKDPSKPQTKWGELVFNCTPLVDLSLLPKDIRKDFEDDFSGKRTLADGSSVYSTGADCIEMLSKRKELPEDVRAVLTKLLEFAKLDKDIGTYYLRQEFDDDGNVVKQSGMLQYLNDKNIVHHVLNCTSTVTSRLSSNRPNMQNIPRGDTSDVKKMFTSRFGKDGFIVECDYTALEVVTLAAFSKDKNLCKALTDGIDMHCMRLATQLGETYEEVLKKAKDGSHPDHARYNSMRTAIKPKAFAYQYGATAAGIAYATGDTVESCQAFIDAEKKLFPEVEAFYDNVITPYVFEHTEVCREQRDDQSWGVYKRGYWQSPGGTCYSFRQYSKTKWEAGSRIEIMEFKPTQIRNYPIQGESGFFVQGICGLVIRWLINNDFFGGKVYAINTVHDAIYFDCHRDVLDVVAAGAKAIMEYLPTHFNSQYGYDMQVPFPAAVEFGSSMHEKRHWHPGVLNEETAHGH